MRRVIENDWTLGVENPPKLISSINKPIWLRQALKSYKTPILINDDHRELVFDSMQCANPPTKLQFYSNSCGSKHQCRVLLLWRVYEEEMAGNPEWLCPNYVLSCSSSKTYKIIGPNVCEQIRFQKHLIALKSSSHCAP